MTNYANTAMGRRAVLLLLATVLALIMSSGVALAVTKTCEANVECLGTNSPDTLRGTEGPDRIYGRGGGDTLKGFGNVDELFGQGGPDRLFGGPEPDNLIGGPANDALSGGEGTDQYFFGNDWGKDSITEGAPSANTVFFRNEKGSTVPFTEDLTINLISGEGPETKNASGTSTVNWEGSVIDRVLSGDGDDRITGNFAANDINATGGADTIFAGAGDDSIDVDDGSGNDAVDCGEDFIGSDNDTVLYNVGDQIAANCETTIIAT